MGLTAYLTHIMRVIEGDHGYGASGRIAVHRLDTLKVSDALRHDAKLVTLSAGVSNQEVSLEPITASDPGSVLRLITDQPLDVRLNASNASMLSAVHQLIPGGVDLGVVPQRTGDDECHGTDRGHGRRHDCGRRAGPLSGEHRLRLQRVLPKISTVEILAHERRPMGSARVVKPGLTLDAHRVLGQRLRAMKTEALALRGEIKTALGSAAAGYQMATRVLSALDYLAHALAVEAAGEYADTVSTAELQALYRRTGEQTAGTR